METSDGVFFFLCVFLIVGENEFEFLIWNYVAIEFTFSDVVYAIIIPLLYVNAYLEQNISWSIF